jgi:hypothetical protein
MNTDELEVTFALHGHGRETELAFTNPVPSLCLTHKSRTRCLKLSSGFGGNVDRGTTEEVFCARMELATRASFGSIPLSGSYLYASSVHFRSSCMYLAFQVSNEKLKIGFDWILSRYTLQQKHNIRMELFLFTSNRHHGD